MATEYSDAKSKTSEINPLRLSNMFHIAAGTSSLLAGGVVAFLLTRETQGLGAGLVWYLGIAAGLLVLGLMQIGQAWRDEKFRFNPDDIGDFAVPAKGADGGKPSHASHLLDVLNNGVQPAETPDNALLNKLYNLLAKLELAPEVVRWHAETQTLRIVKLVVAALGLLLAWVFAKPAVFAWMAPVYLVLVVSPRTLLGSVFKGKAGDQQLTRPAPPTPHGAVAVLLLSIFVPIVIGLVPSLGALPAAPYATSTMVIPTLVAITALLVASTLFILSLRAQTRGLTTSGVSHQVRKDLNVPNLSSGLINSLEDELPFPRKVLFRNTGWQKDGDFGGRLLVEAEQQLNASGSRGNPAEALRSAWADKGQRALVALGALGVLTGVMGAVLAFVLTRTGSLAVGLTALSLFSASQFSLFASRGLWNRIDFTSTVFHILYRGSYRQAQRVAGNAVTGSGSLTESTIRIEHVDFSVCVARVESVAFARKGQRYIQSVDLKPQECEQQFRRIEDFYRNVMQRKAQAYQEEGMVRQLVQGNEAAAPGAAATALLGHQDAVEAASPVLPPA